MEIAKVDHESGLGIFANSKRVVTRKDWEEAKIIARETSKWLDEKNGDFSGHHPRAYAIAYAQVAPVADPWMFFVVGKDLVIAEKQDELGRQTLMNTFFEGQEIFNVEILETPERIEKEVPLRRAVPDKDIKGQFHMEEYKETKSIYNVISVPEACMSFPHRKQKQVDRFYEIRVSYQYLNSKGKVKDFTGWVTGLKAHILQHEADHFAGKNIYHK